MSRTMTVSLHLGLFFCGIVSALSAQTTRACTVARAIDGDTLECADGERVRLLLVNAPEMRDEPLGGLAREFVRGIAPPGTRVGLELDVRERDRYGRLLAHVHLPDGRTLNRVLARHGFAQVMVIPPNVRHVEAMRAAVDSARAEGAGLWGIEAFGEGGGAEPPVAGSGEGAVHRAPAEADEGRCHSSYPDVCIPPPPPDLDCGEVTHRRFRVVGTDPHGFDGDRDGVGCESGAEARDERRSPSRRPRSPAPLGGDDRSPDRLHAYSVYTVNARWSEPW